MIKQRWNFFSFVQKGSLLIAFLFLFSIPVNAQLYKPASDHQMKFVFPFGEGGTSVSVCAPQYQTNQGCCEPPKDVYQYDAMNKACCEPPNNTSTIGGTTRCCVPEGAGQSRYGQTTAAPCGQFCSVPSAVLSVGTFSDCCGPAGGGQTRYNQTTGNPCGQFCSLPSSILSVGTFSNCCTPAGVGQTRWNQTTGNPCGDFCSQPSLIVPFGTESSCCPTCTGFRSYSTTTKICGTCCPTKFDCGDPAVAVYSCSENTGSAICSVISACDEEGKWLSSINGSKYSCIVAPNACPGFGTWNSPLKRWDCYDCYRNGTFYSKGSCACTGNMCNSQCKSFGEGGPGGTTTCSFAAVYFIEEGMYPVIKGWTLVNAWSDTTACCSNASPGINTSIMNTTKAGIQALNPWGGQKTCAATCTTPTHAALGDCFTSALNAKTCTSFVNRLFTFGQMSLYYCTAQCNSDCYTTNPTYSCSTSAYY